MIDPEALSFDEKGLIPAVVQDARTGEVLTVAYMNREALERTLVERETWFWSRSRAVLWHKGETSGNTQRVVEVRVDCDGDALLVRVEPAGPACHTGERTCFYRSLGEPDEEEGADRSPGGPPQTVLAELWETIDERYRTRPEGSYTTYLFEQGLDKILKKIGEEATETIVAAKGKTGEPDLAEVRYESADLLYHLMVLWRQVGLQPEEVWGELQGRHLVKDVSPRKGPGFKRRDQ
ncbi:bifunctional phosphoribosyl-AMP cyclohydrolase/phosphoribosyl-ATP diphosphatase HisIE [Kyrpidia sp.]|uniref:bifunctional phosphoribosyl-AMP cyclohydrolase/phosphoribosyl-ATP diphosphatase HisIE n=1 Tax=Kyrpidia sp. TaxID=2073077 RepID=UPI002585837F|nr:bifunctional phosphoribosyl-AMP cyclohydrolase/phosphoribosyl-ATP diphosphatase HisIE [Kyrpidia sp.]MCL6576220.1 bifunctional phosphoribosyl-AMP cyclohydrolase/phosphoribosyl-ATP diphosphatase HisIE [Kyrpidia sp.]